MVPTSRKKCLIVDDQEEFLRFLELVVGNHGYQVSTAKSVDEAMEVFMSNIPDIVVTDLIMPAASGDQLVAKIRQHTALFPVIIMSGYDLAHLNHEELFAQESVKFWLKSSNFIELLNMMDLFFRD